MIIVHRNYRSYDEVMIKLPYNEFVTIYDHRNIFRKYGHWCFFACLFKCLLFNIFGYGLLICIYLMNTLVNWLIKLGVRDLSLHFGKAVIICWEGREEVGKVWKVGREVGMTPSTLISYMHFQKPDTLNIQRGLHHHFATSDFFRVPAVLFVRNFLL